MRKFVIILLFSLMSHSGFSQVRDSLLSTDSIKSAVTIQSVNESNRTIVYEVDGQKHYRNLSSIIAYYRNGEWTYVNTQPAPLQPEYEPTIRWAEKTKKYISRTSNYSRRRLTVYSNLTALINSHRMSANKRTAYLTNSLLELRPQLALNQHVAIQFSGAFSLEQTTKQSTVQGYFYYDKKSDSHEFYYLNTGRRPMNILWQVGIGPKFYLFKSANSFYVGSNVYLGEGDLRPVTLYYDLTYNQVSGWYTYHYDMFKNYRYERQSPFRYFNYDIYAGYEFTISQRLTFALEVFRTSSVENGSSSPDIVYASIDGAPYAKFYEKPYVHEVTKLTGFRVELGVKFLDQLRKKGD